MDDRKELERVAESWFGRVAAEGMGEEELEIFGVLVRAGIRIQGARPTLAQLKDALDVARRTGWVRP